MTRRLLSSIALVAAAWAMLMRVQPVTAQDLVPTVLALDESGQVHASRAYNGGTVYVDRTGVKTPRWFTIRNNTSDKARTVPFKRFSMPKGSTAGYDPQVVHVKVFKPALFDKLKVIKLTVMSNVTVTGSPAKPKVAASGPRPVKIKNDTDSTLKVCIYNKNDLVRAVPKKVWTLKPSKSVDWKTNDRDFRVSVFKPAVLDVPLASIVGYNRDEITIRRERFTRWQKLPVQAVPRDAGPLTLSPN